MLQLYCVLLYIVILCYVLQLYCVMLYIVILCYVLQLYCVMLYIVILCYVLQIVIMLQILNCVSNIRSLSQLYVPRTRDVRVIWSSQDETLSHEEMASIFPDAVIR